MKRASKARVEGLGGIRTVGRFMDIGIGSF